MKKIIVLCCSVLLLSACSRVIDVSGMSSYKTECIGSRMDGTVTVKAWGQGRNRWKAVKQARRNAVRDVLFVGNLNGSGDCQLQPVILEPNAHEKYASYFNTFFSKDGDYKKYTSKEDEQYLRSIFRDKKRGQENVTYGVTLRVMREELRLRMIADGIIKQ